MIFRRRTMDDLLAELDDDEPRPDPATRRGSGGTRRGAARTRAPGGAVATASRARRQGRVVAVGIAIVLVIGAWWYTSRGDDLAWVPTDEQCNVYAALGDDARADWVERSVAASWPEVRTQLTLKELRGVLSAGLATCDA